MKPCVKPGMHHRAWDQQRLDNLYLQSESHLTAFLIDCQSLLRTYTKQGGEPANQRFALQKTSEFLDSLLTTPASSTPDILSFQSRSLDDQDPQCITSSKAGDDRVNGPRGDFGIRSCRGQVHRSNGRKRTQLLCDSSIVWTTGCRFSLRV